MATIRNSVISPLPSQYLISVFFYYYVINLWLSAVRYRKNITQHKRIFVAAIPKSGSTWIEQFFAFIYRNVFLRPINGPRHEIIKQDLPKNAFNCFSMLVFAMLKPMQIPMRRIQYTEKKINSILVVFRDPRDIVVQRYFHLLKNPKGADEPLHDTNYMAMNKLEALCTPQRLLSKNTCRG